MLSNIAPSNSKSLQVSSWKEESSSIIKPSSPGSSIEVAASPIFPPTLVLNPFKFKICPSRADVVDFPLVPVTPITFALGFELAKTSISFIMSTLNTSAFLIIGWFSDIPGETTILFNFSHGHLSGSITLGSLEILSSYAYKLPPPAFKLLNALEKLLNQLGKLLLTLY